MKAALILFLAVLTVSVRADEPRSKQYIQIPGYSRLLKTTDGNIFDVSPAGIVRPIPPPNGNGVIEGFDSFDIETRRQYLDWVIKNYAVSNNRSDVTRKFLENHLYRAEKNKFLIPNLPIQKGSPTLTLGPEYRIDGILKKIGALDTQVGVSHPEDLDLTKKIRELKAEVQALKGELEKSQCIAPAGSAAGASSNEIPGH